jgi:flagellar basal-body rod protein FlgC
MVNMIAATRAFEANTTALNASKSMANTAIEVGRV